MKEPQHYIVVDDDSTSNMICEFTIRRFNPTANIKLFTEPEEALVSIEKDYCHSDEDQPTILFLDVNMPSMTGWEFLEKFKEYSRHSKEQFTIYMLSSSIEDFSKQVDSFSFIAGFLSKPLKVSFLEEIHGKL